MLCEFRHTRCEDGELRTRPENPAAGEVDTDCPGDGQRVGLISGDGIYGAIGERSIAV